MDKKEKCQNDECVISGNCHYPYSNNCFDDGDFQPLEMTPMQIAVYALNCPKEDKYFEEVADLIERYADTKVKHSNF